MRWMKGKPNTWEHKDLQIGQFGVLVEEVVWNRADVVAAQAPIRKKVEMRWMKGKTNTREHKDLQNGQFGVIVEEAIWNCIDLVILQIPKRREDGMRRIKKNNKNTGTQRLTVGSTKCSCRGSRLGSY